MKEQKTMLQLLSRYIETPFSPFERFSFFMMAVFFGYMLFFFLIRPLI